MAVLRTTVFGAFSPELRRSLTVLFGAGLCFWAGLAGFLPTLPLFIETLGASGQQIGFVMASFAVGLLASRPTLSRLADERGRMVVLTIGMGAIAIAPFLYLLVSILPPWPIPWPWGAQPNTVNGLLILLAMFRAFHGLSIAAFVVAYSALVIDISPPRSRGELLGYMSLVNPIGMALGPALGGYLYTGGGFVVAFLAMGVIGLIGLACLWWVYTLGQIRHTPGRQEDGPVVFWRLLWSPRVRTPALILLMVGLAFGTLSTFIPLFVREVGVGLNVGLIYTASALASFASRLLVGKASDVHGRGRFITISLVIYTVAMGVFWLANSAPLFLVAGLLQGAAGGILIPMIAALMGDRSQAGERGKVFGLAMVGFDLGIALAGPIFGSLADWLTYRNTFGLSGVMTSVALGIFITASSKDLRHSLRFSLGQGRDGYAVDP